MPESSVHELHTYVIVVTNYFPHPMRFDNIWARLFALSSDLALGMTKDPRAPPSDVTKAVATTKEASNCGGQEAAGRQAWRHP